MSIKTILVPVDFSSGSNNALRYALQFAITTKSKIVVFHSNYLPSMFPSAELKKIHERSEGRKQVMLEYVVDKLCKKYKFKKPANISYLVKRETNVINNVLSAAETAKADLIVMGTHGATGFKKILFGSNTAGVISKSTIPVLAIPQRHKLKKVESIVYASDLKNLTNELKALLPIVSPFDATIEILYLDYWKKGIDDKQQMEIDKAMKKTPYKKIELVHKNVSIHKTMIDYLNKYSKRSHASMLVMFPETQNFFEKLFFSSITKQLSFNLKRPLLSIRKEKV
jgi:nucleotide-binding universal stress UspA family protein